MQQLTSIKEVKLFERIRKDCVDDLAKYLKKIESKDSDYEVIVKADPLLVWSFATLDAEKTVSYEISKFLDENCRRDLKATAAVNVIVENGIEKPPVLAFPQRFNPENPNLLIENPDLILFSKTFKVDEIRLESAAITETPSDIEVSLNELSDDDFDNIVLPSPACTKDRGRRTVKCPKSDVDDEGRLRVHIEREGRRESSVEIDVGRRRGAVNQPPVVDLSPINNLGFNKELQRGKIISDIFIGTSIDFKNLITDDITDFKDLDIDFESVDKSDIDCEVTDDGKVNCRVGVGVTLGNHVIRVDVKDGDEKEATGTFTVEVTV